MGRRALDLRGLRGASREDHARRALQRWRASGKSHASFCRSEGIAPATMYRWRRLFGADGKVRETAPVPFVAVDVVRGGAAGSFEIELRDGRRVRVPAGFEAKDLERLLVVLGSTRC